MHSTSVGFLVRFGFAVAFCISLVTEVAAQVPPQPPAPALTEEQQIDEAIAKIRTLVRSQQRVAIRKLMQQYPNTRMAKIGAELLAEVDLYDALTEQEFQAREANKQTIRAYWDARRPAAPVVPHNPVVITNRSDETVLYQVKWRGVEWLGPYHLAAGQTHEFSDPLVFRRVTREGTSEYSLTPGQRYVFLQPAPTALPSLFHDAN